MIHIDGSHLHEIAKKDIENCVRLAANECLFIMDDTNYEELGALWDSYVVSHNMENPSAFHGIESLLMGTTLDFILPVVSFVV